MVMMLLFREKPNPAQPPPNLLKGNFFMEGGMFYFKASIFFRRIQNYMHHKYMRNPK
jgi:mannose-1-phosphate guanylyltransferase